MGSVIRERYEVLEAVGHGGQGTVFRALDIVHRRQVALKARELHSEKERAALLEEARILFSVRPHPNLPLLREDFVVEDRYYLVMDWIEGRSLRQVLEEDGTPGLTFERILDYLGQAAEALDHLHHHDPPVVHQDVKPANLILTLDGQVVLVDFGISRCQQRSESASPRGTPDYVAPEIAAGTFTPASDVFSLAVTAYTLLTGEPPRPEVRPKLGDSSTEGAVRALRRGLATDPARRPASAPAFVEALRAGARRTGRSDLIAEQHGRMALPSESLKPFSPMSSQPRREFSGSDLGRSEGLPSGGPFVQGWAPRKLPSMPYPREEHPGQLTESGLDASAPETRKSLRRFLSQIMRQRATRQAAMLTLPLIVASLAFLLFTARVPAVEGLAADRAMERLEDTGFQVRRIALADTMVDLEKVIRTDPGANARRRRGSIVKVFVSRSITIDPLNWERDGTSRWDEYGPGYIESSTATHKSAYGRTYGRFTYRFSLPTAPNASVTLSARLSSEFPGIRAPSETKLGRSNRSDVTLFVNDRPYPPKEVIADNGAGQDYTWQIQAADLLSGKNILAFAVLEQARQRNGLVIYYDEAIRPAYPNSAIRLTFAS